MIPMIRHLRSSISHRALSTSPRASAPLIYSRISDPIPTTESCPPSRCACAAMPSGLDIDYKREMNGTMPSYAQHVVVSTGRDDWARKIEDEEGDGGKDSGANFARSLKGLVGKGGKFFDPERPVLMTNSSFAASSDPRCSSVHVFPQSVHVPEIPHTPEAYEAFVDQFINSKTAFAQKVQARRDIQKRKDMLDQTGFPIPKEDLVGLNSRLAYSRNTSPTILICGHGSRDNRCGLLGPLLHAEFTSYIKGGTQQPAGTRVGLTSHIGGHAFAGNVVIYLPKTFKLASGKLSPLAGMGIWYGRVEPKHVWGIMEETVERGSVIQELLRGIHRPGGIDG